MYSIHETGVLFSRSKSTCIDQFAIRCSSLHVCYTFCLSSLFVYLHVGLTIVILSLCVSAHLTALLLLNSVLNLTVPLRHHV